VSGRRDEEFTAYVSTGLAPLQRVALLLCQDRQRADDLVQAAITKLYVHWGRARAADHLDAYVRAIVVREFLAERDAVRRPTTHRRALQIGDLVRRDAVDERLERAPLVSVAGQRAQDGQADLLRHVVHMVSRIARQSDQPGAAIPQDQRVHLREQGVHRLGIPTHRVHHERPDGHAGPAHGARLVVTHWSMVPGHG
jgi:DNA-directed RNA polymerase specialized sigma24 family protein